MFLEEGEEIVSEGFTEGQSTGTKTSPKTRPKTWTSVDGTEDETEALDGLSTESLNSTTQNVLNAFRRSLPLFNLRSSNSNGFPSKQYKVKNAETL